MPKPKLSLAAIVLSILPATVWLTARPTLAESAAEECRAKPGPPSPPGSHWYYRVNRAGNRHCWFLAKEGATVRAAATEASHGPSRKPRARRVAAAERIASTPQPTTARAPLGQVQPHDPAPVNPASTAIGAYPGPAGDDSGRTTLAVSWPALTMAPGSDTRGFATMSSSYAKSRATAEAPQPMRPAAAPAEAKSAELQQAPGGFSPSLFTGALAIALLLSGAIVKFACRAATQNRGRATEAWLNAFHGLGSDLARKAGGRSAPRVQHNNPVSKRRVPAQDIEAGLRELVRDLRQLEIAREESQTRGRYDVPRPSYLRVMKVGEAPAMGAPESPQRGSRSAQPYVPHRSVVA
jgi:hypothetical protein